MKKENRILINQSVSLVSLVLFGMTLASGMILLSGRTFADDTVVTDVSIGVPMACTMTGSVDTAHTAEIVSGVYRTGIGTTTFRVICNDHSGFSVYAIGFGDDTLGNNRLMARIGGELSPSNDIVTGTASSGNTSNWAMMLTPVAGTHAPTILSDNDGSFSSYHAVPSSYQKVATFASGTDGTNGSAFTSTYATYATSLQPAGTYSGKVKYTMVHPHNGEAPLSPQITQTGKICYYANASDAVGTMGCQTIPTSGTTDGVSPTSATLLASNFSRTGYGFAGWSDEFDYATNSEAKFYGPQETVTYTEGQYSGDNNGLSLYAVWVKSTGSLQDADKVATLCGTGAGSLAQAPTNGTANLSSVSALTDQRDDQTYAIAKLADGKCWMIENLRLDNQYTTGNNQTDSSVTNASLAQGYNSSFAGLATPESANFSNSTTANSLYSTDGSTEKTISGSNQGYRFPRYNKLNTPAGPANRPASPTSNTFASDATMPGMYSYGNYYTWHAVIADTTHYSTTNQSVTTTSICPTGWTLPKGGNKNNEANNDYWNLVVDGINNGKKPANYGSSNQPYYTGTREGGNVSMALRSYPNNFLYSGLFSNSSSANNRGSLGVYWSSTASNANYSYNLYLYSSYVYPGTTYSTKNTGLSARCLAVQ